MFCFLVRRWDTATQTLSPPSLGEHMKRIAQFILGSLLAGMCLAGCGSTSQAVLPYTVVGYNGGSKQIKGNASGRTIFVSPSLEGEALLAVLRANEIIQ